MFLISPIKHIIEQNGWISVSLLAAALLILKISDSTVLINLFHRLLPSMNTGSIGKLIGFAGAATLLISFAAIVVWGTARNKKLAILRKNDLQHLAAKIELELFGVFDFGFKKLR